MHHKFISFTQVRASQMADFQKIKEPKETLNHMITNLRILVNQCYQYSEDYEDHIAYLTELLNNSKLELEKREHSAYYKAKVKRYEKCMKLCDCRIKKIEQNCLLLSNLFHDFYMSRLKQSPPTIEYNDAGCIYSRIRIHVGHNMAMMNKIIYTDMNLMRQDYFELYHIWLMMYPIFFKLKGPYGGFPFPECLIN